MPSSRTFRLKQPPGNPRGEQLSSSVQQLSSALQDKEKLIAELKQSQADLLAKIKDYNVAAEQCSATAAKLEEERAALEAKNQELLSSRRLAKPESAVVAFSPAFERLYPG